MLVENDFDNYQPSTRVCIYIYTVLAIDIDLTIATGYNWILLQHTSINIDAIHILAPACQNNPRTTHLSPRSIYACTSFTKICMQCAKIWAFRWHGANPLVVSRSYMSQDIKPRKGLWLPSQVLTCPNRLLHAGIIYLSTWVQGQQDPDLPLPYESSHVAGRPLKSLDFEPWLSVGSNVQVQDPQFWIWDDEGCPWR